MFWHVSLHIVVFYISKGGLPINSFKEKMYTVSHNLLSGNFALLNSDLSNYNKGDNAKTLQLRRQKPVLEIQKNLQMDTGDLWTIFFHTFFITTENNCYNYNYMQKFDLGAHFFTEHHWWLLLKEDLCIT